MMIDAYVVGVLLDAAASLGGDDGLAVRQKQGGDLDRRPQQAARIVAQIDHQTFHASLLQSVDNAGDFRGSRFGEGRDADVADLGFRIDPEVPFLEVHLVALVAQHAVNFDLGSVDINIHGSLAPLVVNGQGDLGPRFTLDNFDHFFEGHVLGGLAVNLDDQVAGHDARLISGRADHGAFDKDLPHAVDADADADAAELAPALLGELLVLVGVDEIGVR